MKTWDVQFMIQEILSVSVRAENADAAASVIRDAVVFDENGDCFKDPEVLEMIHNARMNGGESRYRIPTGIILVRPHEDEPD